VKLKLIYCFFILYTTNNLKVLLFYKNNFKKKKTLRQNAKGLVIAWLPLLETFRTFKEDIAIENIRLIS